MLGTKQEIINNINEFIEDYGDKLVYFLPEIKSFLYEEGRLKTIFKSIEIEIKFNYSIVEVYILTNDDFKYRRENVFNWEKEKIINKVIKILNFHLVF